MNLKKLERSYNARLVIDLVSMLILVHIINLRIIFLIPIVCDYCKSSDHDINSHLHHMNDARKSSDDDINSSLHHINDAHYANLEKYDE